MTTGKSAYYQHSIGPMSVNLIGTAELAVNAIEEQMFVNNWLQLGICSGLKLAKTWPEHEKRGSVGWLHGIDGKYQLGAKDEPAAVVGDGSGKQ